MRQTSDVTDTDFPFAEDAVPFILVAVGDTAFEFTKNGRGFEHASTRDKKHALALQAKEWGPERCTLLAAWPGANRTDVFEVDDLDQALAAF